LPADHPDEADEEERRIGHKKHEEPQKEDRQVLFLCLFAFFVAISLSFFSSRSGLHDFNMASPSFTICANVPARRGG
jgi:hypothetical protein